MCKAAAAAVEAAATIPPGEDAVQWDPSSRSPHRVYSQVMLALPVAPYLLEPLRKPRLNLFLVIDLQAPPLV
jgi:hypothetical protein